MAEHPTMSDSTSSSADSEYDVVDELSETAHGDHETTNLGSTEHGPSEDGAFLTPGNAAVKEGWRRPPREQTASAASLHRY